MADNPFDALERLAELLSTKVAEIGLEQITFQPIIDKRTGQRLISAMFVLDAPITPPVPEAPVDTPVSADPEVDSILEGIMQATEQDQEQRTEQERQALHDLHEAQVAEQMAERAKRAQEMKERLRDPGKGFLDDD